jgi:predicted PurR-regulated permease PerM
MVAGKERFRDRFENAFSNSNSQIVSTVAHIVEQIQSYIVVKSLINVINGFASTLIFLLFGVDYAILWGFLVFLFYYIPNIGSLIAILPPILIMIMNNGFEFKSIAFIITIVGIQFTIGNILEPKFIGRQMDLSPVFILLSLVFWGWVWGVLGMFLAVPIAAMVKILCANIEPLKPLAVLMGVRGDAGE